jgi:alpha-D-xyloside xylohydrolase
MAEMEQNGWPLVRSLMLHYWNDPLARQVDDQFLLGSELLVAPILSEKSDTRNVYLPKGVWKNIFTGERFDYTAGGGHLTGAVGKVGSPLVFVLEGGENYYYLSQIVHEYRYAPEVAPKSRINNGTWVKRLIESIFHF